VISKLFDWLVELRGRGAALSAGWSSIFAQRRSLLRSLAASAVGWAGLRGAAHCSNSQEFVLFYLSMRLWRALFKHRLVA
jgi:hypothetical protein